MKTLIIAFCCLISACVFSQNITNTLGTSGVFKIKNGSTDYLTLTQSTGQVNILKTLRLENTTSSGFGIIFKGTDRFIHNYLDGDSYNTFMGINAGNLTLSTTANFNTGIGHSSLISLIDGFSNTAVGMYSLYSNTSGASNIAVGLQSLYLNTAGYQNVAVGNGSLYSNTGGYANTCLGNNSGSSITTGSDLICIGYGSQPSSGTAVGQITLGNNTIGYLRCNVQTITSLSDARDKKNIKDLNIGINFLMKLKPRIYNWDKREWYEDNISDGSKMLESPTAGFIAQELDEVQTTENAEWLNLVLKDNPEKWEATPGNLLPVVIKAVQELKAENDELKEKLSKLEEMQTILALEINKMKSKDTEIKEIKLGEK